MINFLKSMFEKKKGKNAEPAVEAKKQEPVKIPVIMQAEEEAGHSCGSGGCACGSGGCGGH